MRAMRIEGDWGLGNIRAVTLPDPEPGPGEVLVEIRAVSINPRDRIMAMGGYGRAGGGLPLIPLSDGAGAVVALGQGVDAPAVGTLVFPAFSRTWSDGPLTSRSLLGAHGGPVDGTARTLMTLPADMAVPAPGHLSAEEAATLPCAALTAWNAVVEQGALAPGARLLVQGTGAVALFALQFARMLGAEVIVTSASDEKLAKARALGADHGINRETCPDWARAAREIAGGDGLDQVIEVGGAGSLDLSVRAVRPSGVVSLIGVLGGAAAELDLGRVVTRNVRLQGVTVGSRAMAGRMVRAMELHRLRPVIDAEPFALEDLADALAAMPQGRHFGKRVGRV